MMITIMMLMMMMIGYNNDDDDDDDSDDCGYNDDVDDHHIKRQIIHIYIIHFLQLPYHYLVKQSISELFVHLQH
jgi:hypothetical protein